MKKPKKKVVEHWDYRECAEYIAHKLGVKNLNDVAGRWPEGKEGVPYQNFWHVIVENNEVGSSGCYVMIYPFINCPDWAKPIVKEFEKEFGKDQEYWVG